MASTLASYLGRRNVVAPAITVSTIQGSSIGTASITTTTLTGSTISFSTLTGSTMTASTITGNTLTLSTLTVSSINSGAPGVAAYSTLNVSSMNATSSITTSSITTSSIITAPGYNSNISNVIYTSLADSGQTAANFTTSGMPGTAPSGSVISGSYRATAGASSGAIGMWLGSYTYTAGTTYNFTFTGMQGSQALALYVYQYNSAGTSSVQISSNVYSITTSAATVSGSFTANLYPATYTGSIIFYFQALAVNQYVNFTSFSMNAGAMNVGIGTSVPSTTLHVYTTPSATTTGILSTRYYIFNPGDNQDASGTDYDGPWYGLGYSGISGLSGNPYVCLAGFSGVAMRSSSGFIQLAANGNVGIGTTNPAQTLHVYGTNPYFYLGATASNYNVAQFSFNTVSSGSTSNYVSMQIYNGPPTLCLNGLGQVGIGTTNPGYILDVVGTARISTGIAIGGANVINFGYDVAGKESNAGKMGYQTFTTGALDIVGAGTSNRTVKIWDNLLVGNNVGFGTTSPNDRLTVQAPAIATATGTSAYCGIHIQPTDAVNGADYYTGITWSGTNSSTYTTHAGILVQGSGSYGTKMRFYTTNSWANGQYQRMVIDNNGYVGIGNASPTGVLDVQGVVRMGNYSGGSYDNIEFLRGTGAGEYPNIRCQDNYFGLYVSSAGGWCGDSQVGDMVMRPRYSFRVGVNGSNAALTVYSNSYVGIGVASPSFPLHVVGSAASGSRGYYYINSGSITGYGAYNYQVGIFATGGILSNDFIAAGSDIRIKKNIIPLQNSIDLLQQIDIVSYDKIDYREKGADAGVIAQQIQSVLPRSIIKTKKIIPNIYCIGIHSNVKEFIQITVPCSNKDIKEGSLVRLLIVKEEKEISYESTITNWTGSSFDITPWSNYSSDDTVFVYGTEIDDFLSVDKEQIGILAAAGVKELIKQTTEQAVQVAILQSQLSALSGTCTALIARLEALESR